MASRDQLEKVHFSSPSNSPSLDAPGFFDSFSVVSSFLERVSHAIYSDGEGKDKEATAVEKI